MLLKWTRNHRCFLCFWLSRSERKSALFIKRYGAFGDRFNKYIDFVSKSKCEPGATTKILLSAFNLLRRVSTVFYSYQVKYIFRDQNTSGLPFITVYLKYYWLLKRSHKRISIHHCPTSLPAHTNTITMLIQQIMTRNKGLPSAASTLAKLSKGSAESRSIALAKSQHL